MKRVLLLGGGHAHIEVLRQLAERPIPEWQVTLVSPNARQLYSGMVPGFVAGHYCLDDCAIDLGALSSRAGATFWRNRAALVDPAMREVMLADGNALSYDLLSLDIGASTFIGGARGVGDHAIPIRPLETAIAGWERVQREAAEGHVESISVVGGGAAAVEMAMAMHHWLGQRLGSHAPHVRLVTDRAEIVPEFPAGARRRLKRILSRRGIALHAGSAVVEVGARSLTLANGTRIVTGPTFWIAGAAAPELVRDSGFATDGKGYLLTDDYLRSTSHPDVLAAGDCATQQGRPLPKAGVFAVRAAPRLTANLRAAMTGEPLARHATGSRYLALVSTGSRRAVAIRNGLSWEGAWVWRWKDRIDRRFVARYA